MNTTQQRAAVVGALVLPELPGTRLFGYELASDWPPWLAALVVSAAGALVGIVLLLARVGFPADAGFLLAGAGLLTGPRGAATAGLLGLAVAICLIPVSGSRGRRLLATGIAAGALAAVLGADVVSAISSG